MGVFLLRGNPINTQQQKAIAFITDVQSIPFDPVDCTILDRRGLPITVTLHDRGGSDLLYELHHSFLNARLFLTNLDELKRVDPFAWVHRMMRWLEELEVRTVHV